MARYKRKRKDGQMSNWDMYVLRNPDRGKWSWRWFWSNLRYSWIYWWTFLRLDRSLKELRLIRRSLSLKSWLRTPDEQRRHDEELWKEIQEWREANPWRYEGLSDEERMQRIDEEREKSRAEAVARENRPRLRKIADWLVDWCRDWKRILKLWIFPYDDP